MNSVLCITLRFLDPNPQFHGRDEDGKPEWPPSPLRFFQAILAASATCMRGPHYFESVKAAFLWLEKISPLILTPKVNPKRFGFRMYVPNNSGDLMTSAWARGATETTMSEYRVEKDVCPTSLFEESIHYLFPVKDDGFPHFEALQTAARSITHLGWGIDMVAGNAEILSDEQVAQLEGEIWRPSTDHAGTALRVPIQGTLDALMTKHQKFLQRLSSGGFNPVPPLSAFRITHYRRATDPVSKSFLAFSILKPDAENFRPFDTVRNTRDIAAMVRGATAKAASQAGWPQDRILSFVQGHGSDKSGQSTSDHRLMFLPIPSITPFKVDSIRRVIIVVPQGTSTREVQNILHGADLVREGETDPIAMLSVIPKTDKTIENYTKASFTWSTVTPVILPGYDDPAHLRKKLKSTTDSFTQKNLLEKLNARVLHLLQKAFLQAGFAKELVNQLQLDWGSAGFRAGVDLAHKYVRPANLNKFPAYHVQVRFPMAFQGPLAIGAGRYRGFGLFARHSD